MHIRVIQEESDKRGDLGAMVLELIKKQEKQYREIAGLRKKSEIRIVQAYDSLPTPF